MRRKLLAERQYDFSVDIDRQNPMDDARRFGQTFLLDIVKTEQMNNGQNDYIRPAIPDDDVLVVDNTSPSEQLSRKLPSVG